MLAAYTNNDLITYLDCVHTSSREKITVLTLHTTCNNIKVVCHVFSKHQVEEQVLDDFKAVSPYQVSILLKFKSLYINLHRLPLHSLGKGCKPSIYTIHGLK